ncbi:MAG TPA: FAD synthetase family protein [Bacillota bacterium]
MKTHFIRHKSRTYFQRKCPPSIMALGCFDGVHQAHRKVIQTAVDLAKERGLKASVMTFTPHPKEVIHDEKVGMLTTLSQKKSLIRELGVDVLYVVRFDQMFAALSPKQFVLEYVKRLHVQHVVAGFDFTYGARGQGNMSQIVKDGDHTFTATTIPIKKVDQQTISSTIIRNKVSAGQLKKIRHYLGRNYKTIGKVVPLRNTYRIHVDERYVLPKTGMYEIFLHFFQQKWRAIVTCNKEKRDIRLWSWNGTPYFNLNHLVTIEWLKHMKSSDITDDAQSFFHKVVRV